VIEFCDLEKNAIEFFYMLILSSQNFSTKLSELTRKFKIWRKIFHFEGDDITLSG